MELSSHLQVVGGLRFDHFDLTYHNNRNGDTLGRVDNLVSPRAGVVVKPVEPVSIYASYSVSYLPSSGDQFSSLTTITEQVKPEKFTNYEVGAKWDLAAGLSAQTARLPSGPDQHPLDRSERSDADRADRQPAHQRLRARCQRQCIVSLENCRRLCLSGRVRHQRHHRGAAGAAGRARCRTTRSRCGTTISSRRNSAPGSASSAASDMFVAIDNTVDAAWLYAGRRRGLLLAEPAVARCRPISRTCSTRSTTSTPTATPTSRRDSRSR